MLAPSPPAPSHSRERVPVPQWTAVLGKGARGMLGGVAGGEALHDLAEGGGHGHDDFGAVYLLDNVTLTTIGVDVGSSTFHLMFARVHLVRDASRLSARYEVA